MKKSYLWIIILIFVVSCAPTTASPEPDATQSDDEQVVEPTANLSSEKPEIEPEIVEEVMNTVVPPTEEPVESDASMLETAVPTETGKSEAAPVTVDLSQLTPVAGDEGEEIVQPAPGIPDAAAKLVADVTADLSTNLGIDSSEVTFKSIAEVQWRDSGLGCPQPGMSYLQVITDGFQIVLTVNSQDHYYHTRSTTTFIYCANPSQIVEPGTLPPNFNE